MLLIGDGYQSWLLLLGGAELLESVKALGLCNEVEEGECIKGSIGGFLNRIPLCGLSK